MTSSSNQFQVAGNWQPTMRRIGLDAETVFSHPDVRPWRQLPDRQNCTLDFTDENGKKVRFHVKRYHAAGGKDPAAQEVAGHQLLVAHQIPTAELIAWGKVEDGRSFTIFADLSGHTPADKLVESGTDFDRILVSTADLAARLHQQGLHHRDLYLCHFMVRLDAAEVDVRLIDVARVRRLPHFLRRWRWVVKDLAEFWYSTLKLPIREEQRVAWLARYCEQRHVPGPALLRGDIEEKVRSIARHDAKLNRLEPTRNVSLPW